MNTVSKRADQLHPGDITVRWDGVEQVVTQVTTLPVSGAVHVEWDGEATDWNVPATNVYDVRS